MRNPTSPDADGTAMMSVLTEYTDWTYTGDDPTTSPDGTTFPPPAPPPGAEASTAAGANSDWARWVLKKLKQELKRQHDDPHASPARKQKLAEALGHLANWT
jgi:hypothetical protein